MELFIVLLLYFFILGRVLVVFVLWFLKIFFLLVLVFGLYFLWKKNLRESKLLFWMRKKRKKKPSIGFENTTVGVGVCCCYRGATLVPADAGVKVCIYPKLTLGKRKR